MTSGMRTIGYHDDLVLPVRLTPRQADRAITLEARLEIGVCKDICVPVEMTVAADLPPGTRARDPRIAAALAARPYTAAEAGVGRVACTLSPIDGGGLRLVAEVEMTRWARANGSWSRPTGPISGWPSPTRNGTATACAP